MIDLSSLESDKIILRAMPLPDQMPNGTIVGQHSLRLPSGKRAVLFSSVVQHGKWRDTETAFTRAYLASFPKRKCRSIERSYFEQSAPPSYCAPFKAKCEWLYVDIRAAYPSIYSRMTWDVNYMRGRYFGIGVEDYLRWPFAEHWKTGRSYVVNGCNPNNKLLYVHDGRIIQRATENRFSNPQLVSAVWDVLAAIARVAVDNFDARYFLMDGAIVPTRTAYPYMEFLESLGLIPHVREHGYCEVRQAGGYRFGHSETQTYNPSSRPHATNNLSVTTEEASWILRRFERLPKLYTWNVETSTTEGCMATDTEDQVVLSWEDVLAQSANGPSAPRGLREFVGRGVIELREFHDEERGRTNKHTVLSATVRQNGQSEAVVLPDRDAKLLRGMPNLDRIVLYATVELDAKGTARLKPARKPAPAEL